MVNQSFLEKPYYHCFLSQKTHLLFYTAYDLINKILTKLIFILLQDEFQLSLSFLSYWDVFLHFYLHLTINYCQRLELIFYFHWMVIVFLLHFEVFPSSQQVFSFISPIVSFSILQLIKLFKQFLFQEEQIHFYSLSSILIFQANFVCQLELTHSYITQCIVLPFLFALSSPLQLFFEPYPLLLMIFSDFFYSTSLHLHLGQGDPTNQGYHI